MATDRVSFDERRRATLDHMASISVGDSVEMTIRFKNNDVPEFLKRLDDFEKESEKTDFVLE